VGDFDDATRKYEWKELKTDEDVYATLIAAN
jgi:hypothetical protein